MSAKNVSNSNYRWIQKKRKIDIKMEKSLDRKKRQARERNKSKRAKEDSDLNMK